MVEAAEAAGLALLRRLARLQELRAQSRGLVVAQLLLERAALQQGRTSPAEQRPARRVAVRQAGSLLLSDFQTALAFCNHRQSAAPPSLWGE